MYKILYTDKIIRIEVLLVFCQFLMCLLSRVSNYHVSVSCMRISLSQSVQTTMSQLNVLTFLSQFVVCLLSCLSVLL